ncbi:TerD family protein [Nocardioides sp.]|uniref:TerD family protein n=1 Tax=Nocardioides sp. TaxID=35761 RepID=UPI0025D4530D|nr:TerD family protein [Nocardioides sp.]
MIELQPGQEIDLVHADGTPLTRLRMGVGWDKERTAGFIGTGAPDIDLDASAVQFSGTQLFDLAFYNHLSTRDGSVVHLGDNKTGSGAGDDEAITVDLAKVYARVDTIVFLVSSYQGHTLEWINNAYCRVVAEGVEGPDGAETEIARLTLTAGVPETGVVLAKIVRDGDRWRLRAIGAGVRVTKPSDSVTALARFL